MNIGGDEDDDTRAADGTEGQSTEGPGDIGDVGKEADLPAEHAEPEEDDGGEEAVAGADGEKPSRGQARFQKLANETKAAREDAAAARREAEDLRRQQWQQSTQVTEQQERERLALMTPDERADYHMTKMRREFDQQRQQDRVSTQATMDKVAYDAKATINPVYAKLKDEVEARFQQQMQQGRPVEREIILKLLLGERALSGATAGGQQRRQAKGRVDAARVPAGSGKGDAASDRGKAGDSPAKRLEGVLI